MYYKINALNTFVILENIEYEIVDHCNLKCQNCNKFSYLKPSYYIDIKKINEDFAKISTRFSLKKFTILGGEPLLHPNINQILLLARKYFKNSFIKLISNGVLFCKKDFLFFTLLSSCNITIEISKYDLNVNYEKIKNICSKFSIKLKFIEKNYFKDFMDKTGSCNAKQSFKRCRELVFCPNYSNGKLYVCGYAKSSEFLCKTSRLIQQAVDNGIDVMSSDEQINQYLFSPVSTCKYCKVDAEFKPWRQLTKEEIEKI